MHPTSRFRPLNENLWRIHSKRAQRIFRRTICASRCCRPKRLKLRRRSWRRHRRLNQRVRSPNNNNNNWCVCTYCAIFWTKSKRRWNWLASVRRRAPRSTLTRWSFDRWRRCCGFVLRKRMEFNAWSTFWSARFWTTSTDKKYCRFCVKLKVNKKAIKFWQIIFVFWRRFGTFFDFLQWV